MKGYDKLEMKKINKYFSKVLLEETESYTV